MLSFISNTLNFHPFTPSEILLMIIIPIMLSTPGGTGDNEATLIDHIYQDDAKSLTFFFFWKCSIVVP